MPTPLHEEKDEALRDAVRSLLGSLAADARKPVVLTGSAARPALRALLAGEFSDLAVLYRAELSSATEIVVGRLKLPRGRH